MAKRTVCPEGQNIVQVRIPSELHRELRVIAAYEQRLMSDLMTEALRLLVAKHQVPR